MEQKSEYKKGLWTVEEDRILMDYIRVHGKGKWNRIANATGLKRCGKSCRLRWMNYLSPSVKRGDFSEEEDDLIIRLHNLLGNRWSLIAGRVPGRTDNQVKNHWNTHLSKKLGVKKVKTKVVSRQSYSGPSVDSSSTVPPQPPLGNPGGGDASQLKVMMVGDQGGSHQGPGILGLTMSTDIEHDEYEFFDWFSHDELIKLHTPTVMELLDESLDFVWHGF